MNQVQSGFHLYNKLSSNLGLRAIKTLGWMMTARMWMGFVMHLPQIIQKRNLFPMDKFMSKLSSIKFKGKFGMLAVNPSVIDNMIDEDPTVFSSIREIYIRDCYLKHHQIDGNEIKTVVDLGANRGMVSLMFTPVAERIIAIEAQDNFIPVIYELIAVQNGFKNVKIGNYFVGSKDNVIKSERKVSFAFIQQHFKLETIDFLKMDIEGSEFDIIHELPFGSIKYISMEVHRDEGDPADIGNILSRNGFKYVLTDSTLKQTLDFNKTDYIFAWNTALVNAK